MFVNQCRFLKILRKNQIHLWQDCGFINTTVYSRGETSIRKAYQHKVDFKAKEEGALHIGVIPQGAATY